jgi:hypothetical protein
MELDRATRRAVASRQGTGFAGALGAGKPLSIEAE